MTKKFLLLSAILLNFMFLQTFAAFSPIKHKAEISNADPSKELLIQKLEELNGYLVAGDYEKAKTLFILPADLGDEVIIGIMKKLIEQQEISADGIKILSKKGTYGKLVTVFPEKGKMRAEKNNLNPHECYGLKYQSAEVMAYWNGKEFKLFRIDDIGKVTE